MVITSGVIHVGRSRLKGKGRLKKFIETTGTTTEEVRYEYNADNEFTRSERYINGKPYSAYTYEYDAKENPNALYPTRDKGQPWIPSSYADYVYKHNITKATYSSPNATTNAWEVSSATTYAYDYNANGFPTLATVKGLDKNGVEVSNSTQTFTYQGCQ